MGTELGATGSVFPADGLTKQFLTAQARGKDFKSLVADEDAHYDDTVDIDLGTLEPLIACPSSPDNVKPVSEVAGTEVAQVAVGSSVNSSFRDLGVVAHALDGKHVAPGIAMAVSPGSRQTLLLMLTSGLMTKLIKAGVRELEVACGPCIGMGFARPPKDTIEGEVLLRLGDNISTDHIMPAGAKILPLRSNIPAIAEHVFEYVDPTFPERAKKAGGGFIVAGENYGQGSSREHAAVAPMFLGVHLVLAKGFARIHMDNLVNSGIPPVTFADPKGYNEIQQGDRLRITNLLAAIRGRGDAVLENLTRGTKTSVRVELRPYQREVLLAGGGIRYAQSRRRA